MENIVERLRTAARDTEAVENASVAHLLDEAADTIDRLRGLVNEMHAAIETSGFVLRNTDSGPNLVRY